LKFDKLSNQVIGCAIEVHKTLGPGLLESTYEQCLAYELKSVDNILPIHQAQLLTYMKLSGIGIGLLMNFNVKFMKTGIKRMVL
jgi:hypothetical protein